jgi:GrpB-like predicted nucleotidyltransferase (UPF0157 family)
VVRLEHVGSTAVPGLPAKPIIDLVLEVADFSNEPAYLSDLQAAGYVLVRASRPIGTRRSPPTPHSLRIPPTS